MLVLTLTQGEEEQIWLDSTNKRRSAQLRLITGGAIGGLLFGSYGSGMCFVQRRGESSTQGSIQKRGIYLSSVPGRFVEFVLM